MTNTWDRCSLPRIHFNFQTELKNLPCNLPRHLDLAAGPVEQTDVATRIRLYFEGESFKKVWEHEIKVLSSVAPCTQFFSNDIVILMCMYAVCVCAISTNILYKIMYTWAIGKSIIYALSCFNNIYFYSLSLSMKYLCYIHILPAEVPLSYQAESGERIRNSFSR